MSENESERTTDASRDGREVLPHAFDVKEQGKPPSWNDIPNFGFGKFYIYLNLVFGLFISISGARTYGLIPGLFTSVVIIVMFLGLKKRKKFGLILFYLVGGLHILFGLFTALAERSPLPGGGLYSIPAVFRGGLAVAIGCALLVYFYKRRHYFNR
jgi:hypothetical protein